MNPRSADPSETAPAVPAGAAVPACRGGPASAAGEIPTSLPLPGGEVGADLDTRSAPRFYGSLFRRYWKLAAVMVVLMASYAGVTAARLLLGGVLLDGAMVHFEVPPGGFIEKVDRAWVWLRGPDAVTLRELLKEGGFFFRFLLVTTVVFGVAAVAMAALFFFKEYLAQLLIVRMTVEIRQALFSHLTRQSVAYFNRQRSGEVISRLTNDVSTVQLSFRFFFEDLVQQPLTIAFALCVALVASPRLFFLTLPFYAILMLPVVRSGRKVKKHGRGRLEKLGLVTEAIEQLFSGIRIVKAFGMERLQRTAFIRRNAEYIRSTMKMNRAKLRGRALQELLYNVGTAVLVALGVLAITLGYVEASGFFVFLLAMIQVYNPIKAVSRAWNQIQESRAGLDRILDVLREEPMIRDHDGSLEFPGLEKDVRFDGVGFSYKELDPRLERAREGLLRLPVLTNISFAVPAGQVVALVGPSGSGKSTIVDLLARFYDPQEGRILVDGRDIRAYRHASYLRSIAIVSQDPFLFNATIGENIRHGREGATPEEIEEAARVAYAHDFIIEQPEGYDTLIGDRGVMLSGGQRQRITIARAVLKKAQILILDEATSSLDSQAEREVQCAIDNLMRSSTTFVIAHRLSTILRADRIMVIEDGRIVESGRHAELLARRRRYFDLWRSQNPHLAPEGGAEAEVEVEAEVEAGQERGDGEDRETADPWS